MKYFVVLQESVIRTAAVPICTTGKLVAVERNYYFEHFLLPTQLGIQQIYKFVTSILYTL